MPTLKVPLYSSLIARSLLALFCVMIFVLSIVGYLNVTRYRNAALQSISQETIYIRHVTAEAIDLAMWNLDKAQVQQQLEALKGANAFCGARVKDPQANLFAEVDFPKTLEANEFISTEPIYFDNPSKTPAVREIIGTIELCADKTALIKRIQEMIYEQILFMSVAVAVALIGCYAAIFIFLRPLKSIRYAMGKLAHTMEPIRDESLLKQNEIGMLTRGFNMMVEDISNTQQQLKAAKDAAESAAMAKSEFLSNMSHELRTPMHAILNYANMGLKRLDKEEPEKLVKYFSHIHTAGNRLLGLLNRLLDLSRMESGKMQFTITHEDFREVIDYVKIELDSLLVSKNIEVVTNITAANTKAMLDKSLIIQVFINILSNAIRHSSPRGIITVTLEDAKLEDGHDALRCSIANDGETIPDNELEIIFDQFVQSSKTKTGAGGTGLGLAISREIIKGHGGKIWAENRNTTGVVFSFLLPKENINTLEKE